MLMGVLLPQPFGPIPVEFFVLKCPGQSFHTAANPQSTGQTTGNGDVHYARMKGWHWYINKHLTLRTSVIFHSNELFFFQQSRKRRSRHNP
jgi:hypothetical protein